MSLIQLSLTDSKALTEVPEQLRILKEVENIRSVVSGLLEEERHRDALERTVEGLRMLRNYPDMDRDEFRLALVALLFDLAEIHFELKDFKQSEKELEILFKVLSALVKKDAGRYGHLHILAMDLSTRILRSRRKAMDMLARQQMVAAALYEKVNAGMVTATDKLVESLRKVAQLLAAAGDYKASLKFFSEALKYSKKRSGRMTRKEVRMTIEMAEIMMRIRTMRPRARRLLEALLPHAITLGTIELEEDILALIEVIDADIEKEPVWKSFLHRLTTAARSTIRKEADELKVARDETILTRDDATQKNRKKK